METQDFLAQQLEFDSDCISDDDSEYLPSSDSDSGDEIEPSPRKKKRLTSGPSTNQPSTSRRLSFSNENSDNEDIPLAQLIRSADFDSSDDEPLSRLRQKTTSVPDNITEEDLTQIMDEPMWAHVNFERPDITLKGEVEPTPTDLRDPLSYFRDLVTDEMIENISFQTNLYSTQKNTKSINTSKQEIDLFLGLYLRMGLMQGYAVRAFWAEETRYDKVADCIARNRFEKIASHLHFTDNASVTDAEKTNKVWKLNPWLSALNASLKTLPQEECSAVDEVMVPFKGRSDIKQFMRNKPHKWGFKMWGRAGTTGTLYEFEIYQGAKADASDRPSKLSKSAMNVINMTTNIPDGKNFKVFADNFFTSLALVEALKARDIFYVGTVRVNRLKGCPLQNEKELKKVGRGAFDEVVDLTSGAVAVRWFDNRTVDLLSTYVGAEPTVDVQRYDKKQKRIIKVPCPAIVKEYNKFMGGIDLHDMLTALYRFPLKGKRWYMYIFYYTFHMMVVNAWLRYRKDTQLLNVKATLRLAQFQSRLATQLIAPKALVGRPRINPSPMPTAPCPTYRRTIPTKDIRSDGQGHLPTYSEARGRCKGANCNYLTFVKCSKCNTFLCFNKDRNCYAKFHI